MNRILPSSNGKDTTEKNSELVNRVKAAKAAEADAPEKRDKASGVARARKDLLRGKVSEYAADERKEIAQEMPLTHFSQAFNRDRPSGFPLHTYPSFIREYVETTARSIHCPADLVAIPLLVGAGAAIGRAGKKLRVKEGWEVSSCLWGVCLLESSGGKTPAIMAALNYYDDKQDQEYRDWDAKRNAHKADPTNNPPPGPYPALKLSDTTRESLQQDLVAGPVLFARDELVS